MKRNRYPRTTVLVFAGLASAIFFLWQTNRNLLPLPAALSEIPAGVDRRQVLDRYGRPLTVTFQNQWNLHDYLPLHEIPETLQKIFVLSEDKRFFAHSGVDWYARFHALLQNIVSFKTVRGASTISEQVIRMIHPRPRTLWSRWLEGIEANRLEQRLSKADILEFYLNQVPYASNRRGVLQASRFYFDRDIDTLNLKEMIALAVLVRAPSRLDLYRTPTEIEPAIGRLAATLVESGVISDNEKVRISEKPLTPTKSHLPVNAAHFIRYVTTRLAPPLPDNPFSITTTLDSDIQETVQRILDERINELNGRKVNNGAAIVVDHSTNEVLAWVIAGGDDKSPGRDIDAVITPRQPGSAMKPFLYTLALEKGWTAATPIADSALVEPVGSGLHAYHNYSHTLYGTVSLRYALGNSLNIPAIRTIRFVGVKQYLSFLKAVGFSSLTEHPDFYGHGLALGNGEVTLFELVQAYTVLARYGNYLPLTELRKQVPHHTSTPVFSRETASIIADILSDPSARTLEFGTDSILNFPLQTAVKTGTSSDYRDAWAVGFNYRYTVGVWAGNLDGMPMDGVTGSVGPALALRSIFNELTRHRQTRPLYLSPGLVKKKICDPTFGTTDNTCFQRTEWFAAGSESQRAPFAGEAIEFKSPVEGLQLAMDPRIPDDREAFEFRITGISNDASVDWVIDDQLQSTTRGGRYLWPLAKGSHKVRATIRNGPSRSFETTTIQFSVK